MNIQELGRWGMSQMQTNYRDRDGEDKKKFRHAYVLKSSFDLRPLKAYCERIIFAVEGYADHVDNIRDQLEESLANFDDEKDVIIPVGNSMINLMAGAILQKKLSEKVRPPKKVSFAMGIWTDGKYIFWNIYMDAGIESYEIIQ